MSTDRDANVDRPREVLPAVREEMRRAQDLLTEAMFSKDPAVIRHAAVMALGAVDAVMAVTDPFHLRERDRAMSRPGDVEPHDDLERTLRVVRSARSWTMDGDGRLHGLVSGDMGYESTSIVVPPEDVLLAFVRDDVSLRDEDRS